MKTVCEHHHSTYYIFSYEKALDVRIPKSLYTKILLQLKHQLNWDILWQLTFLVISELKVHSLEQYCVF